MFSQITEKTTNLTIDKNHSQQKLYKSSMFLRQKQIGKTQEKKQKEEKKNENSRADFARNPTGCY